MCRAGVVPVCRLRRDIAALKQEFDAVIVSFSGCQVEGRPPIKVADTHVVPHKHVPAEKKENQDDERNCRSKNEILPPEVTDVPSRGGVHQADDSVTLGLVQDATRV